MSQEQMLNIEDASISTKAPKAVEAGTKPADWVITLPDPFANKSTEELVTMFGESVVADCAAAQMRVKFQATVRTLAEQGKSDEEIAQFMQSWKPGDKLAAGANPQTILKNFGNMSPEQRASLLAQLQNLM